ncbi:MAG TPA: hypothetical protein VMT89_05485, partial [Candidatus Acidoferrales bacterium]|nr:hypothetical protein [Candidatus Acidoferrales bacterium]
MGHGKLVLLTALLVVLNGNAYGQPVAGDCDGSGSVTIDEIITGVNIALGDSPLSLCPSFDTNGDG